MVEEVITKRLHVSGLTPAIRPADLSQKLGSFGTIKALDDFDKVDGLGQPRKFGYVTIETTKSKLARCMNILSGVTWKGARLRIGEAKPDFRERIAQETKAAEDGEPPLKKRRLPRGVQGVHASDMTLITPENVHTHAGWRVTPLGRMVKPIRMRPDHPLPEPLSTVPKPKFKKGVPKKAKKAKLPPTRARRRTIDPTKWGSQHLKGLFLENSSGVPTQRRMLAIPDEQQVETDSDESEDEDDRVAQQVEDEPHEGVETEFLETSSQPATPVQDATSSAAIFTGHQTTIMPQVSSSTDLAQEKNAVLGLLQSIFGDREEWGGEESLDSDVDMDAAVDPSKLGTGATYVEGQDKFEEVPMDIDQNPPQTSAQSSSSDAQQQSEETPSSVSVPEKSSKLKDIFAPREEAGGFSLLGHLDLDLDLDDDVLDASFTPAQPASTSPIPAIITTTISSTRKQTQVAFNPHLPLFFPLPEDERGGFRGKTRDPLDVAKEKGIDWREFCRTQTSEEIRQRWEEQKVELTRDWKRRHREAIKSRRRRGGGDGE